MKLLFKFYDIPFSLWAKHIIYRKVKRIKAYYPNEKLEFIWCCRFNNYHYEAELKFQSQGQDFCVKELDKDFKTSINRVIDKVMVKIKVSSIKALEEGLISKNVGNESFRHKYY